MSISRGERDRRRFADEEEDEDVLTSKRRRGPEVIDDDKIEHIFSRLYTKSNTSMESTLESLAHVLEADLDVYKERIISLLSHSVITMPEKLTVFSTLVGLLNAKNFNFGGALIEKLLQDLLEKLEEGDYFHAINVIVFFADLVNCKVISVKSIVEFFEGFLETAFEEGTPQVRSDWYIYAVLHCLPWIGYELHDKSNDSFENILSAIEKYLNQRNKTHVKLLQVWSATTHEQEEYLDCLWAQISKLREDSWKERHIIRHYVAFDGALTDALQHNLPSFTPPEHTPESVYPLPRIVFRLFDYTDCPEEGRILPGAHSIERFLIEEELLWIIEENCSNRKECAAQLLDYPKRSMVPLNYIILEVIFSQLFLLPDPPLKQLFFGSLLCDLCKLQSKTMPQVLAQAAELFYQRIDTMHPACIIRLIDWFSFHMSNFEYRWPWADWGDCLSMESFAPKRIFVQELIEKIVRFSYHERVVEFLPSEFSPIIPEKCAIKYELNKEENPGHDLSERILNLIRDKAQPDDYIELVRKEDDDRLALSTFLSVVLYKSKATFSHTFAALTRMYPALKELISGSEDAQMIVLVTVYDVWKLHHQMMVVVVRKLLVMSLIDAGPIVEWIFSDGMKQEFERLWTWEILCNTLEHVCGHVQRSGNALEEMKRKRKRADSKNFQNENEEEMEDDQKETGTGEDEIQAKENEVAELREFLKNLLLNILHKFTVRLTEHIVNCESEGTDFSTSWFRLVSGRFKHVFLLHWRVLSEYKEALEAELFKPSTIDANVMEIYNQFVALRS